MLTPEKREAEIWAIAGGKGGTGKSFVISCLGTYLAIMGKRVILIDADLGGANLHTFLGIDRPKCSLTDFFDKKSQLNELIVESRIPNLGLLVGALQTLAPDGIKYAQKQKLLRHIKSLDADHVLIDLGAGAHFNTIDTFLLADKMIVVVVPEITSIENVYYFLRAVFLRKIDRVLTVQGIKDVVKNNWEKRGENRIRSLRHLIEQLQSLSAPVGGIIHSELSRFKVYIVLNQVKTAQDVKLGNAIQSICLKHFGLQARYVGYIEYDEIVPRCINKREPYMQTYPASRCAKEIERITDSLLHG